MKFLNQIICGDCLEVMKQIPTNSIDLIATDPPYGIAFMGKDWDTINLQHPVNKQNWAYGKKGFKKIPGYAERLPHYRDFYLPRIEECFRVLKPGGIMFWMCASRLDTLWRLGELLEEAGFRTEFMPLIWIYKSGFPKAQDIGRLFALQNKPRLAQLWRGWKTATGLKPAFEFIFMVQKPLVGTYTQNIEQWGVGGINIAPTRIPYKNNEDLQQAKAFSHFRHKGWQQQLINQRVYSSSDKPFACGDIDPSGRFPPTILTTDLSPLKKRLLGGRPKHKREGYGFKPLHQNANIDLSGRFPASVLTEELSKFFDIDEWAKTYGIIDIPKTSKRERDYGLSGEEKPIVFWQTSGGKSGKPSSLSTGRQTSYKNPHPTVKPLRLFAYLIALASQPTQIVLDPFAGTGTTCLAAKLLGRNYIGIEIDEQYCEIARLRVNVNLQPKMI